MPIEHSQIASWAIAEGWPGTSKHIPLTQAAFPALLELPGHYSYCLGEPGAAPIGFGQIWLNHANGTTNLVRILIDPQRRGQGLGKLLCRLLLAEASRISPGQAVKLRVYRENHAAVSVYRALGFETLVDESNAEVLAMASRKC
ncbi:GNAT family N-acetyltransferase [Chitinimonas viridis]|uniref:GNAT family N-acetyltransferase n=1 Tax=Chitinimonas viridis TaxID=664880 RepID=A0ABT8BBE6_9NEIS|nr:GNAT family N-acetyltransferase [Chitinimonas viridis]MDN3579080.1 GNAT family N-acetyltransferase [Chitinimonas viridis]